MSTCCTQRGAAAQPYRSPECKRILRRGSSCPSPSTTPLLDDISECRRRRLSLIPPLPPLTPPLRFIRFSSGASGALSGSIPFSARPLPATASSGHKAQPLTLPSGWHCLSRSAPSLRRTKRKLSRGLFSQTLHPRHSTAQHSTGQHSRWKR